MCFRGVLAVDVVVPQGDVVQFAAEQRHAQFGLPRFAVVRVGQRHPGDEPVRDQDVPGVRDRDRRLGVRVDEGAVREGMDDEVQPRERDRVDVVPRDDPCAGQDHLEDGEQ
ncbi:MAG: hypothetical protein AVDCRST_MAG33-2633 [uncultured Thermomicrobiales bacterium]|uniref:Uncharacterized protein n=1 Tax=uncultured Thermomicrobiales bacterium TaxID=1645740 RepID=A0A6J4V8A2_9BACT|nr:MAG: hypothetical protein AVDCRST_MAG33-2633 [uncultured Thermomicrobiales bacterium]